MHNRNLSANIDVSIHVRRTMHSTRAMRQAVDAWVE
jgi:hypothetical protein